ncbi:MAG: hypothetical protein JWM57_1261 [Phycisphaerales bacterium]|nr:hypothetical protein [Phycisphaerales bacterium]
MHLKQQLTGRCEGLGRVQHASVILGFSSGELIEYRFLTARVSRTYGISQYANASSCSAYACRTALPSEL